MQRRVVITGLGVLAANGIGKEQFWKACIAGRSGIQRITRFDASMLPTQIAGEIAAFDPAAYGLTSAACARLERGTQLALAAAHLALEDAGLMPDVPEKECVRTGVYLGAAMASVEAGDKLWNTITRDRTHAPTTLLDETQATTLLASFVPSNAIAAHYHLHGPCCTLATGCSAGADAIGQAFWTIQEGRADRMLAGGADAAITRLGLNAFSVMRALSTRNDEPERASRPYDADRDGFVMGEGAGIVLLEERELALARGAPVYAEVLTFTSNNNAYHMTALPAHGAPLQQLLCATLEEAGITPHHLGYINSHGSSTRSNDVAETAAYKAAFGERAYAIPVSATKSMIGHAQGAASAIEAIVTALVLERHILPPTINQERGDPRCDLDYVPNVARPARIHVALTHSSGFGGVNSALLLARPAGERAGNESNAYIGQGMARRVVITGIGVVAPNGTGTEAFWQATCRGVSGIKRIARCTTAQIPISVAGAVDSFVAEDVLDRKLVKRTDRMTHFALAAVAEALTDARLDLAREPLHRVGAAIANTMGGVTYIMAQIAALHLRGPRFMSAHSAIAWPQGANVGQTAVRYGLQGYCITPVNDTVGGLDALGMAYRAIRRGAVEVMITGGCEALLHPTMLMVLAHGNHCTTASDLTAYRPFDRRANGLILAEGAGICILEAYDHALQRGAPLYGEVVGYGQTHDAATWNTPPKSGTHYARALTLAMHEGAIVPTEIGYVSLDGRATLAWDRTEADALHQALGAEADRLPVSVPRTTIGHSYAAAGALDTITAVLGLRHRLVPPTINCQEVDDGYGLNVVRDIPGHLTRPVVLIGGRGLSGANVVLAIKRLSVP